MPERVPGRFHYAQAEVQRGQFDHVILAHRLMGKRVLFPMRRIDGDAWPGVDQLRNAACVIVVVVRDEDRSQLQAVRLQRREDGSRISRVDNGCLAIIANEPDIVVPEGRDRNDFEHGRHDANIH